MNFAKNVGIGLALVLAGSAAGSGLDFKLAQPRQDDINPYFGITGSIYFPTQTRFKNAFSTQIFYYGFTVAQNDIGYTWKVRPDFGVFSANTNGNHLYIIPVMASVSRKFAEPGSNFQPYAKLGAGLAYFSYRIDEASGRTSASKFGTAASAEVGFILGQRIRVFGAYSWFSKESGFDFSGFQIGATVSIFKM